MNFDELDKISNNPGRALVTLFNNLESNLDTTVVGTLNGKADPFTYMMDTIVGQHSGFLNRLADGVAVGYKTHARNISDLSQHMSDEDWENVFSTPSGTTLRYSIPIEEIRKRALPYSSLDGELTNFYKKLVIPKDTIFTLPGSAFWLAHAVEFRLMEHGGVQVIYDTLQTNPFADLGTNYPDRNFSTLNGMEYISVLLPVKQIAIKEIPNKQSNDLVGFSMTDTFEDKLFRIRAFITPVGSNSRIEMTVVFKRTNYDPSYPTMVIDLIGDNTFTASIPSVYLQNGLGTGNVTILVYTTKGAYERDLTTLNETYHKASYYNYNNAKGALGDYEKNIIGVDGVYISSETPITGGADAMAFQDIKNMVIYGHRLRDHPISEIDLTQTFKLNGYTTIKALDFPNYRLYRVTRDLPEQSDKPYDTDVTVTTTSTIGVYVGSVLNSLDDIVALGVAKDNGARVTLLPGSVIDVTNASPEFYNSLTTDQLINSNLKNKVDVSTAKTLVAIPFYYVLDTTNSQARLRAYYLNKPYIVDQSFFYENPYLGLSLGISKNGVSITNDGTRYIIDVVTTSSDTYKQIPDDVLGIQLGIDIGSDGAAKTLRGFLVGKNADGERMWRFIIETDFDLDSGDLIYFKGFRQYGEVKPTVSSKLTETLNFIFTYQGTGQKEKSTSDRKIDQSLFDSAQTSIVETEFNVRFGRTLPNLYTSIRPMIGDDQYLTYEDNVPELYVDTEFKYENKELVVVDGKAVVLHRAGDPVLDANGKVMYKHLIGQTVRDADGNPILKEPRKVLYYWDFIAMDYNYYLSQDEYDTEYLEASVATIADTIMDNLASLTRNRLERTVVLFKPKSTIGFTDVIVNENVAIQIKNDLRFSVMYYLTHEGVVNKNLKNSLITSTHRIINDYRKKKTLSSSAITKALHDPSQEDIKDVKVMVYSGDQVIDVISNVDDTNGFGVRKKLAITADNFLTVKEDIEVLFKEHAADQSE